MSKEDSEISEEIKAFIKPLGILNNKIFLNIPRHNVIARLIRVPSADDEEIAKRSSRQSL